MEVIEKRCLELFARDYKYSVIHNSNGEICGHYPRQIVFLEYECTEVESYRYHSTTQSVSFSYTNASPLTYQLLLIFLCHCSNHAQHTVVQGAKVSLHLQPL